VAFPPYRSAYCDGCRVVIQRAWKNRNRKHANDDAKRHRAERFRRDPDAEWRKELDRTLRSRFHITVQDYDRLYAEQEGRCGICRKPGRGSARPNGSRTPRLSVDHDRRCCSGDMSCGRCVRGLLCGGCNPRMGFYELFKNECASWRNRRRPPEQEVVLDDRKRRHSEIELEQN
jgi:hypothetical protein